MTTIHHGDCIEVMNQMPAESVDAIVTDPPYGLGFMGRKWDGLPPVAGMGRSVLPGTQARWTHRRVRWH